MKEKLKSMILGLTGARAFTIAAIAVIVVIGIAIVVYAWRAAHKTEPVTTMTQTQAETAAGVNTAAHNAGLTLGSSQSNSVAKQIEYIRTTEQVPVYVVETTGANVVQATEQATKDSKADFSIVTAKGSDEKYDLTKLASDTKVELNQYNVQAYKPIIRQVSYAPRDKIIGVGVAKKITKDGQYIGVGVDYDIDDKKVYAKVTYSW